MAWNTVGPWALHRKKIATSLRLLILIVWKINGMSFNFACSVILSCLIFLCDWNFFMLSASEWNFSFLSILCKLAVTRYMVILQHSSCSFKILLYIGSSKWQYFLLLINYNHCRRKMGSYKVICYLLPKISDDIFWATTCVQVYCATSLQYRTEVT